MPARRHHEVRPVSAPPPFLRPPGARAEAEFVATCSRGGDCAMACPVSAIVPLGPAYGEAQEGTPAVMPRANACVLCDDLPCIAACPSGALQPVPRAEVDMGLAVVDYDRCYAARGRECDECVAACPVGETALRVHDGAPVVGAACTGCGKCEMVCPADPTAIAVRPG